MIWKDRARVERPPGPESLEAPFVYRRLNLSPKLPQNPSNSFS
jgi:hypothetical protein